MKASSICGSDIRAIYRAHLGKGPEGYQPGTIAGHEPCGADRRSRAGLQRIQGRRPRASSITSAAAACCEDCKRGLHDLLPQRRRAPPTAGSATAAMRRILLAEENTCIHLPDNLTYIDGALVACGIGTAWEALTRMQAQRPGPAAGHRPRPGRPRRRNARTRPWAPRESSASTSQRGPHGDWPRNLASSITPSQPTTRRSTRFWMLTQGKGVARSSIDCSGAAPARLLALKGTRQWGRCAFVGEGNNVHFDVSPVLIHQQITLFGSWVTSVKHLQDLVEHLDRWNIHPEVTCTERLPLQQAAAAYDLADKGQTGKVCIVF